MTVGLWETARSQLYLARPDVSETYSRYAIGVRAINGSPSPAPTPMALGLNVERLIQDRVTDKKS